MAAGLQPLLGNSSFISNGQTWLHQRRIIDPAFEGRPAARGLPAMWDATLAGVGWLATLADGREIDIEPQTSHIAADVIFFARSSRSWDRETRWRLQVFAAFREHQDAQPMVNLWRAGWPARWGAFIAPRPRQRPPHPGADP